jgi:CheY-like chemotaxis protein
MGSPGGLNILVVEDHADTAAALKHYLEYCGHQVATAATCQEALAHPGLARTELILCDLNLPDGSGWELLPALRARIGPAYAVAITAPEASRGRGPQPARGLSGPLDQTVCAAPVGRVAGWRPG